MRTVSESFRNLDEGWALRPSADDSYEDLHPGFPMPWLVAADNDGSRLVEAVRHVARVAGLNNDAIDE